MAKSEAKRPRRSAAQWREIVERQAASGQSVEAFCRSESIGTASFYQWRRRMEGRGRKEETTTAAPTPTPAFLDLGALGSDLRWDLELDLGAGIVLRLRG